ncbi:hypothetical protein [Virgibacillus senegalensis]|uniref:hypothetical protein n=1 Tax=Virgibacillus senegalensis TaxID=1499679 RepID=UPI00069EAF4C|nr:hypothetical protein [Virgibacillus senegalensis]
MGGKALLDELEDQLLKMCVSYGIEATQSKDLMQLWAELVENLDQGTKRLLYLQLQKDVANRKGVIFQQMLDRLQQEELSFSIKSYRTG